MITSKEICTYYSEEKRAEWHRKRGIEDPKLKVVEKERMEDPAQEKPETKFIAVKTPQEAEDAVKALQEDGMTKEQRYRARNKEKLAARARERRAKK